MPGQRFHNFTYRLHCFYFGRGSILQMTAVPQSAGGNVFTARGDRRRGQGGSVVVPRPTREPPSVGVQDYPPRLESTALQGLGQSDPTARPEPRAQRAPPLARSWRSKARVRSESQRFGARPAPASAEGPAVAREPENRPVRSPSLSAGRWGGVSPQAGRHPGGIVSQPPRAAARRGQEPVSGHVTFLREAPPLLHPLGPPPPRPRLRL